ncbi:unnamed protein product [Phytomonas sp. Hart1]|nr:unnamed protein product [Phytomonas sp. Hart1]|eukprot:CCW70392.1 unnamed protein product [Phytomonas sp. isolate Hart1]
MKREKEKQKDGVVFELTRKHGFKESRTERKMRLKHEKEEKWGNKLQKEDLSKLAKELDSLVRAKFLSPQQKERKRLVEKMINSLEKKNEDEKEPLQSPVLSSSQSSVFEEDLIFKADDNEKETHDALSFLPRCFKSRRKNVDEIPELSKSQQAEKQLLEAVAADDDDQEAFLASLI